MYTNRKEFRDYGKLKENLETIRTMGKYAVIEPELKDFESNIEGIDAAEWRDEIKYSGGKEKGFIYAVSVDTEYPIKDSLYSEARQYEKYSPFVRGVLIVGASSIVLLVVILIWLTAVAGRDGQSQEISLNWFDRWKTELAAGAVVLAWGVPVVLFGSRTQLLSTATVLCLNGCTMRRSMRIFHRPVRWQWGERLQHIPVQCS